MKKILLVFLFITQICNAQLHIGPKLTLRDSSGYLVLNGQIKTWSQNWLMTKDLDSSVAGVGLNYSKPNGLSVNVGSGIYIENDTLKASVFTRSYNDSITLTKVNSNPILRFSNTNSNIAYIKLNEQKLLSFIPNYVTALENFNTVGDLYSGRDVVAYSNFRIGDNNTSDIIIDISRNFYAKELHTDDVSGTMMLYVDSDITTTNGFSGTGFTPSSENYYGDGSSLMTGPDKWITIQVAGISYLIPLYLP